MQSETTLNIRIIFKLKGLTPVEYRRLVLFLNVLNYRNKLKLDTENSTLKVLRLISSPST